MSRKPRPVAKKPKPPPTPTPTPDPVPSFAVPTMYGPVLSDATVRLMGEPFASYQDAAISLGNLYWNRTGAAWNGNGSQQGEGGGDYYDRAGFFYRLWSSTGDATWKTRADAMVGSLRQGYFIPNNWSTSFMPQWMYPRAHAVDYLVNASAASLTDIGKLADWANMPFQVGQYALLGTGDEDWQDNRSVARCFIATTYAYLYNAPTANGHNWQTRMTNLLNSILASQNAQGFFQIGSSPSNVDGGGTPGDPYPYDKPFTSAIMADALLEYYLRVNADARIPAAIKRLLDFEWTTNWVASAGAFKYMQYETQGEPTSSGGGTTPAPDLNCFWPHLYAWYYSFSGDATYRTRADEIFINGVSRFYTSSGGKQFNETFATGSHRYLGYRGTTPFGIKVPNLLRDTDAVNTSAAWYGAMLVNAPWPLAAAGPAGEKAFQFTSFGSGARVGQNVPFPQTARGTWQMYVRSSTIDPATSIYLWTTDQTEATVYNATRYTLTDQWRLIKLTAPLLPATAPAGPSLIVWFGDNWDSTVKGSVDFCVPYCGFGDGSLA